MTGSGTSHARAVSTVIGIVAEETALTPAERFIERVYRDEMDDSLRHDIASVLRAVQLAADFREKGSVARRLIHLDDIETRWADAVGEQS